MNDLQWKSRHPFSMPVAGRPAEKSAPHGKSAHRAKALALLTGLLLLAGVPAHSQEASKKQEKLLTHESGFLPEDTYSKLRPDPGNSDWLIYFKDPDVMKRSDTFVLEPVKVFFVPEVQQRDINPEDQAKLEDYFTKAIRDALQAGHYNLVSEPGPGVKLLRFAITNVEPNGGKTNAVITGTTAVATHAVAPGVGEVVPRLKVGKVSIEGEMVDSASGEIDMAFMTSKSGRRFFSGLKAFQKWGDIDAAFRSWAKNFRQRLDKAHAS